MAIHGLSLLKYLFRFMPWFDPLFALIFMFLYCYFVIFCIYKVHLCIQVKNIEAYFWMYFVIYHISSRLVVI